MKTWLVICMLFISGIAIAQTSGTELEEIIVPASSFAPGIWIGTSWNEIILHCSLSVGGKAKDCQITPGHTLDEAVNSIVDAQKIENDLRQTELDKAWKYGNIVYDIAVKENKSLQRCADSLYGISKSIDKIVGTK